MEHFQVSANGRFHSTIVSCHRPPSWTSNQVVMQVARCIICLRTYALDTITLVTITKPNKEREIRISTRKKIWLGDRANQEFNEFKESIYTERNAWDLSAI